MVTTNAMRLLTQAGIPFTPLCYAYDESDLSGVHAAQALGLDPDEVFKTLVLRGERTGLFVCCIPVAAALDLKDVYKRQVLFAIGHQVVFSLGGWSPLLPAGFLVSCGTLDTRLLTPISTTGLLPSPVQLSRCLRLCALRV